MAKPSSEPKTLHAELMEIVKDHDDAWNDAQMAYESDFRFAVLGDQWDAADRSKRGREGRPALVYNRLPAFIRRVTNEARQDDQQVRVIPESEGDAVTADILQGVIRGIQITSDASSARATAHESAAIGGYGWYRVAIEKRGQNPALAIVRERDARRITLDPWAKAADRSDAQTAVVRELISCAEYDKRFPDHEAASLESDNETPDGWVSSNSVTIAEVWRIEDDGKAHWYIIDAKNVLDETHDYPGRYIPIIPIFGEEWEIDGKVIYKGLVRDAKTPQQMLNYWKSATAENLAQNRKARADVTPGMIAGFEAEWEDDTINSAFRHYNPGPNGEKPSYPAPPQIPTGTVHAAGSDSDELKAIMGIFDASMGAKSNETSGRAIMARAAQGDLATFHFKDNLSRAIRLEGKILCDLIPAVYGSQRLLQVAGEDGQITTKEIGAVHKLVDGTQGYIDITGGQYGVIVTSGPGYSTKRQETLNLMIDAARVVPQIAQLGADKMVGLMDFNGSFELAQRLKASLPPGIAQDNEQSQIPPQVKAALDQAHQTIDQLTQALQQTSEELNKVKDTTESAQMMRMREAQLQAETDIQIAQIKAQTDIEVARINEEAKRQQVEIQTQAKQFEAILNAPPPVVQAPPDGMYCEPASPGLSPVTPLEEAQYVE